MTTPPTILVPLDGSKNAENAVPMASLLQRAFCGEVRLLHVFTGAEGASDLAHADDYFQRYARDLATRFHLPAEKSHAASFRGVPAEVILDLGDRADWIVIASHGRGGFRAMFIGSVADKVVRGATVPVLVVPGVGGPPEPPARVVVALDGSPEAERGLVPARQLAEAAKAEVILLQVEPWIPPVAGEWAYYSPAMEREQLDATHAYLQQLARPGERVIVAQGDAAPAIIEMANRLDAGLVVMSATGKGLAGRVVLGSTTDRVLHLLHRPLLILPKAQ